MKMENLLTAVMEMATPAPVSSINEVPMPSFDATINLGTPSDALKKTKAELDRQEKAAVAELDEKIAEMREAIKHEDDVIAAGDYDINTEMAKPDFDRDALAQRRAAAEVAIEVREVKRRELENLKDERDQIVPYAKPQQSADGMATQYRGSHQGAADQFYTPKRWH